MGRLLGPLLKSGLPLMKNVLKSLAKSILTPLELTTAESSIDAAIQKKIFRTGYDYDYNLKSRNGWYYYNN